MVSEVKPAGEKSPEDEALDVYLTGLLAGGASYPVSSEPEVERQPDAVKSALEKGKSGNCSPVKRKVASLIQDSRSQSTAAANEREEQKFLTLKVGELTLATTLSGCSGVVSYPDSVSTLPEQPDWFLGLFQYRGANIAIADAGRLVNHGRSGYRRSLSDQPYLNVLLLKGRKWAVACDDIGEIVQPLNDEICWREQKEKMPWLMGTMAKPSAAIIDMRSLIPI